MLTTFERHPAPSGLVDRALARSVLAPFWLDDLPPRTPYPRLPARRYDLVVVGGGYTGLWTALRAVQRTPGIRVAVVEARTIGWAASGRNGGFVEASLTHGEANGRRRWAAEIDLLDRLGRENLDAIGATVAELELDCDFERTGALTVALEDYQVRQLRDDPTFMDRRAVRAEVDSPTYLAGAATDGTALVHPAKLAVELARAATAAGVEIAEHTRVEAIGRGTPVEVRTEHGPVLGDRVVLATNAFPSLLRRYRRHTVPVYDHVLVTEPLTAAQLGAIGWRRRQGVADMSNQFHYYRLTPDDRILWGGYDAVYHLGGAIRSRYEDRDATYRRLAGHFLTTFPQLADVAFTHRWAGVIDTSTRFCAFFGSARRGRVAYAAGFTGLGVAASRFAADVMLDRLSGAATERTACEMVSSMPLPFPPEPLAALGIGAARWSLDRADHREGRRNLFLTTLDKLGMGFDS